MENDFTPRLRIRHGKREIFDPVRRKFVALTPEEGVRQQLIYFLVTVKKFPPALLQVETALTYNGRSCRADLVAYDHHARPLLIAECKAPEVKITQEVFEQIARYNLTLQVPYLLVTNGLQHFFCGFDVAQNRYRFEEEMPEYGKLEIKHCRRQ
ncbi:MAG: type I restriction enzyme HsdR N-terminal domain-containing protein [Prevotellaceae bacterium]|jgi:type I site-specific restriction endonuclease|nr:type I restriction enzyme HsdR N-terminal domain-containing protein [Prevotellaceae bacterium]